MTRFAFLLFLGSIIASTGTYAESVLRTEQLADKVV